MIDPELSMSGEQTPLSELATGLGNLSMRRDVLRREDATLQTYLAANQRSQLGLANDRNQLVSSFIDSLQIAHPLYRAAFEIGLSGRDAIAGSNVERTLPELSALDIRGKHLLALNEYLGNLTTPTPALHLSPMPHTLTQNPQSLSYPSEHELRRTQIIGLSARLFTIAPAAELIITSNSSYSPEQGMLQRSMSISVQGEDEVNISTDLKSIEYDSWLEKPRIGTKLQVVFRLLPGSTRNDGTLDVTFGIEAACQPKDSQANLAIGADAIRERLQSFNQTRAAFDVGAWDALKAAVKNRGIDTGL